MDGYMGRLLKVDLGRGSCTETNIPVHWQESLIGGKGWGAQWLWENSGVPDPWGPQNPLLFLTGPLTGTLAPAMRGCVVTRSPLSRTFLDSYFGGHFAQEIKYCGYDGIVILGAAPDPVVLVIDTDGPRLIDGSDYWGMDTFSLNRALKENLANPELAVAGIGPAGENGVGYALISCEFNRQAGRGGAGAVMGMKKLKAVALFGRERVEVRDKEALEAAVKEAHRLLAAAPETGALTLEGTPGSLPLANHEGLLPVKNYRKGSYPHTASIGSEAQRREIWLRDEACAACPIRCGKVGRINRGPYAGPVVDIVEYENASLLGANLGIRDVRALAYLNWRCDALGMDSMSAGATVGFFLELAERDLLPEGLGEGFQFGDPGSVDSLLKAAAYREGYLGELMGLGVKEMARHLKNGSEQFAVHIKGLESPAWGPRGFTGMGLALMTADRGGCHQRGFPVPMELEGRWQGLEINPLSLEHKGELVTYLQNYSAGLDTLVKCDFGTFGLPAEMYCRLLAAVTGRDFTPDDVILLGERVWNRVRQLNLRYGFTRRDDDLPPRFYEPLPDGPYRGHRFTEDDVNTLLNDYYHSRGWDQQGRPTPETLSRLGL